MAKTKRIDKIREALIDDIFSMAELENIMAGFGYMPIEEEAKKDRDKQDKERIAVKTPI